MVETFSWRKLFLMEETVSHGGNCFSCRNFLMVETVSLKETFSGRNFLMEETFSGRNFLMVETASLEETVERLNTFRLGAILPDH